MRKNIFDNQVIIADMEEIYLRNLDWRKFDGTSVLITGATGMLASYLVYYFAYMAEIKKINVKIIAGVRDIQKAERCFGDLVEKNYFRVRVLDLLREIEFKEKIDYIIHTASLASPQHYAVRPIAVAEPNAIGTYYLLKAAELIGCKGFLFFSTGDVYGKVEGQAEIFEDTEGYVDTLDIHSCYNESKRMGETWCRIFGYEKKVPVKIARIWHTYSPSMDWKNDPRVFSDFIRCVVEKKDITILSDGSATRTFCYITDAIAGFMYILLKGNDGEAYNVCNTNECHRIRDIARVIADLVPEQNMKVLYSKRDKKDPYLENNAYKASVPQNKKLKSLGWECNVCCREGFARVLQAIRQSETEEIK